MQRVVDLARLREEHLCLCAAVRRLLEHELVGSRIEAHIRLSGQGPSGRGMAEREVVFLDRDDVREVRADLEPELEGDRLERSRCAGPDGPACLRRRSARARSRSRPAPGGPARPGCAGRRRPSSTRPSRTRAGAAASRRSGFRAGRGSACPRRRGRSCGRRGRRSRRRCRRSIPRGSSASRSYSSRRMRAPEDCASAVTTISSTFTCGGRVSAKRTHSATSSGRTGPPSATLS